MSCDSDDSAGVCTVTCPLCGEPNGCAMAAGGDVAADGVPACWCAAVTIPAGVLAKVPPAARDRACICARCAAGAAPPAIAPSAAPGMVRSPCTQRCELDASGRTCTGCARTIDEIERWPFLTDAERRRVLARLRDLP